MDGETKAEREALGELARQVKEVFFIPASPDKLLAPMASLIGSAPTEVSEVVRAFCANIRSVVSTAGIPYRLAFVAAQARRHQLLVCAAELEGVVTDGEADVTAARADADRRMRELCGSREGRDAINHEVCSLLLELTKQGEDEDTARQLILQGTVLTWGALEALSRDLFRIHLNFSPEDHAKLSADPSVRRRFELTRVPFERLADLGFDLSRRLGDLLVEQNDLADLGGIRATFAALFPGDERLNSAFGERDLWVLFQRRNLIAHRQGIVDRRYRESSGEDLPVGERLVVLPRELSRYLYLTAAAARAITSAVLGTLSRPDRTGPQPDM